VKRTLTANEKTVIGFFRQGMSRQQIARRMNRSPGRIREILQTICAKMEVLNLPQKQRLAAAIEKAQQEGQI
jgi:DNA-binding NarL/FixJ family response regulator